MARARSVFALVTLVVAATTLAACTPSVSSRAPQDPFGAPVVPGQGIEEEGIAGTLDAPSPRTGTDTVTVALVGGAQLPTEMAQAFTEETGFSVAVVPIDGVDSLPRAGADVVLGLDGADAQQASQAGTIAPSGPQDTVTLSGTSISGVPAAVAYGRDDVCVIADKSWMSANKRTLPTSFQELSTPRVRTLLAVPDPVSSSVGRAFLQEAAAQTGEGLGPFVQTLSPHVDPSLGAVIGAWTAVRDRGVRVGQVRFLPARGCAAFAGCGCRDEHGCRFVRDGVAVDVYRAHHVRSGDEDTRFGRR